MKFFWLTIFSWNFFVLCNVNDSSCIHHFTWFHSFFFDFLSSSFCRAYEMHDFTFQVNHLKSSFPTIFTGSLCSFLLDYPLCRPPFFPYQLLILLLGFIHLKIGSRNTYSIAHLFVLVLTLYYCSILVIPCFEFFLLKLLA